MMVLLLLFIELGINMNNVDELDSVTILGRQLDMQMVGSGRKI